MIEPRVTTTEEGHFLQVLNSQKSYEPPTTYGPLSYADLSYFHSRLGGAIKSVAVHEHKKSIVKLRKEEERR